MPRGLLLGLIFFAALGLVVLFLDFRLGYRAGWEAAETNQHSMR